MNVIYISLNEPVEINKFIKTVQNLLSKYGDTKDCILKLEILKVTQEQEYIPKLEYKPIEDI